MYTYENACGATAVSEALTLNVFNSTGFDEQQNAAVELYPNPANDFINVKTNLEGEVTLRVVDLLGRVVFESEMSEAERRIATSALGGKGLYTLQVIQNDIVTNIRFVVIP